MGVWYTKDSDFELIGFLDADYARCRDSFKSTSGATQFLGEKLVGWFSKNQDYTMLSSAKAKYVSLSDCCAQVIRMQTQLKDYGFHFNKIPIYCDSTSAIAISYNPVQHSRTKHITVCYHFIKEHVEKVIMTKVIKGEFDKLESIKINDVLLTCNTSPEIFNEEFNRMSKMENDLFTYEVEIAEVTNIPCDLKKEDDSKQQMSHEPDNDMEYDPSDVEFIGLEVMMKLYSLTKNPLILMMKMKMLRFFGSRLMYLTSRLLCVDGEDKTAMRFGDRNEWEYENEHEDDERYELCGNETHELLVCNIRRFEMIKYSFEQDEEYVAVKEDGW
ncbi:hypothetical protein Tco_0121107 [Tanacetum coccineum]